VVHLQPVQDITVDLTMIATDVIELHVHMKELPLNFMIVAQVLVTEVPVKSAKEQTAIILEYRVVIRL